METSFSIHMAAQNFLGPQKRCTVDCILSLSPEHKELIIFKIQGRGQEGWILSGVSAVHPHSCAHSTSMSATPSPKQAHLGRKGETLAP